MKTVIFYYFFQRWLFLFLIMAALTPISASVYGNQITRGINPLPGNNPVSYSLKHINGFITIQWQLHQAGSMQFIAIEKTTDFRHHQLVALVPKKGNTHAVQYSFQDPVHRTDTLYFRLQIREASGKSSYSSYVTLPPLQMAMGFNIHPLPNDGKDIHLSFDRTLKQPIQVTIADLLGQVRYSSNHYQTGNSLHIRLGHDFLPLASGSYQIMVSSGEYFSKKILLVN